MNFLSLAIPSIYHVVILVLCAYLLIRGVTPTFIGLFAGGALLQLLRSTGYLLMSYAPGGFNAHVGYLPFVSAVGYLGLALFLAGFFSLAAYLQRAQVPQA